MSRRKKGSNRYKKVKHDVAVCHERIRNRRQDFLHKVSKKIVSENQTIIIEDLNVRGMLKIIALLRVLLLYLGASSLGCCNINRIGAVLI